MTAVRYFEVVFRIKDAQCIAQDEEDEQADYSEQDPTKTGIHDISGADRLNGMGRDDVSFQSLKVAVPIEHGNVCSTMGM
jgi:hypothetical protein